MATDVLSGVAATTYSVNGGAPQSDTAFSLSDEGEHTITYFSTDKAGNAEAPTSATVRIDMTAPTIGHTFAPSTYTAGAWTNGDVTVTFECAFTYTATAKDQAGNFQTATGSYKVIYRWDGFLQPITDTAHQVSGDPVVSMFKGNSTVPAKLEQPRSTHWSDLPTISASSAG